MYIVAFFTCPVLYARHVPVALPEGTIEGRLPNGLHYLILNNPVPEAKVEFRLVMRVGSVQETEAEKGCAHFLEHLAFGGTTHFPGRTLVHYLESLGMKYGIDINAFTGYDRTIYMFSVPVHDQHQAVIDSSLLIVRDWLDGISFLPDKVENEKGIIQEELRSYTTGDDFYNLKIGQGIFKDRLPLGTADDIRQVTPSVLKAYYAKWYVPSLATLVVVGDIDPKEMEQKIKERFFTVNKGNATDFHIYPLEYAQGVQISEVRDSLLNSTKIELLIPHPCIVQRTVDDAVRKETANLLLRGIAHRFRGKNLRADVSDAWYLSDKNHFVLSVEGKERDELLSTVTAAVAELNALACKGWDEDELEDIRAGFCERLPIDDEGKRRLSACWCDDFVDYVISGDRYITFAHERRLVKEAMLHVQSKDLQSVLADWLAARKETLLVACRSHEAFGAPLTEQEITDAWEKGMQTEPVPYIYTRTKKTEEAFIETPPCLAVRPAFDGSLIADSRVYTGINVWEVMLKNGIRLIMRPTQQSDSVLYLNSFAPFGISSLSDEAYPLLEGTGGYIDMGGLAQVDGELLSNYLSQREMALTVALENHWHGFMGMAPVDCSAEFFNYVYEKMFHPELRYQDFEEIKKGMMEETGEESILHKMLKRDVGRRLAARMDRLMGAALPRPAVNDVAGRLNLDSIAAYYKELYTRPEGTTYVVSGNFHPDSVMQHFVAVFGRIPASESSSPYTYPSFELPGQVHIEGFSHDNDTQTVFDYLFYGHFQPGQHQTLTLKLMRDLLRNRLISVLRERESLVYSPYVSLFYEGIPWSTFYFDLNASADNKNMERIDVLLKEILHTLRTEEVSVDELQTIKRSFLLAKREALDDASPTAWRNTLTGLLKNGESLVDFEQYEQSLDAITPADVRKAFEAWITPDNYVLLYLSNNKLKNDTTQ